MKIRPTAAAVALAGGLALLGTPGCERPAAEQSAAAAGPAADSLACAAALTAHLRAVSSRDLAGLAATLSPRGDMQLTLQARPISRSVDTFLAFHEGWFADTSAWTWDGRILDLEAGCRLCVSTVEATYREPDRDGAPYFNRMAVGYTLRREDGGAWRVVRDQAVSLERSTDAQN